MAPTDFRASGAGVVVTDTPGLAIISGDAKLVGRHQYAVDKTARAGEHPKQGARWRRPVGPTTGDSPPAQRVADLAAFGPQRRTDAPVVAGLDQSMLGRLVDPRRCEQHRATTGDQRRQYAKM